MLLVIAITVAGVFSGALLLLWAESPEGRRAARLDERKAERLKARRRVGRQLGIAIVAGFLIGGLVSLTEQLSDEARARNAEALENTRFARQLSSEGPFLKPLAAAYLVDAPLAGLLLMGADLSGANLSGANLSEANLSDADLRNANLSGANLSEYFSGEVSDEQADGRSTFRYSLGGAILNRADLWMADLSEADLTHAFLFDADLTGADLSGATLTSANFSGATLIGTDFTGVRWDPDSPPIWPDGVQPPDNAWSNDDE